MKRQSVIVKAAVLSFAAAAHADTFSYTSQVRYAGAYHPFDYYGGGYSESTGPFTAYGSGGYLGHDSVDGWMTSFLAPEFMHARGSASAFSDGTSGAPFGAYGSSGLTVEFTTTVAMQLRIEGGIRKGLTEQIQDNWADAYTNPASQWYDPEFNPSEDEYLPSLGPYEAMLAGTDSLSMQVLAPGGLNLVPSSLPRTPLVGDSTLTFDFLFDGVVPAGSFSVNGGASESWPFSNPVHGEFYVHIPTPGVVATACACFFMNGVRRRRR